MSGEITAWGTIENAYRRPWSVADEWRANGGQVVGVLGHDLPVEIVTAAGLLPIRLSPLRLDRAGGEHADAVPPDLAAQLTASTILVLGALLSGVLDWVDAIAIGRDSEAHTNLFYAMRELTRMGEGQGFPPFAFCDLLRMPSRHAARYNRIRVREFADVVAGWGPQRIDAQSLSAAIEERTGVGQHLRDLNSCRTGIPATVSGSQMLMAAAAAQILPASSASELLAKASGEAIAPRTERLRVFVTGSGQDDVWTYDVLERADATVVGEDHEWSDDGRETVLVTTDPWDGLVDHYHLGRHGSARSGLKERTLTTAYGAHVTEADGVLQIVFEHDESPPWESPELRAVLGTDIAMETVTLRYGEHDEMALRAALELLRTGAADV